MPEELTTITIQNFGDQWVRYPETTGFFASADLFQDVCDSLFSIHNLEALRVLDVGSGTGRFVNIFLDAGATEVVAVEPSAAMEVLARNTQERAERVTLLQVRGDAIPNIPPVDFAFSFGVLHHIPDPTPVVRRVYDVLKPGGKFW